ncbi:MFS transporter [Falsibacillus pallidus]|uniref:Na+/melibiose symporter-like transporter n=1 Tax=Falsibacillus pallidus TaxID=493781 RepID=A0A370GMU8_9BACI|nr:MFS transporter [Falsibacillus pallidus]RDI43223.1 Na+/melibiose symporter-like transporter [Falsibacillus pallidus]
MNIESIKLAEPSVEKASSIWKNTSFVYLLISGLLLSIGNKLYEIVLPLLMYDLTHSSVAMANMRTAELLPNLFFGIVVGVIVDRLNKKKWALWMIGLQAGLLTFLWHLSFHQITHLWMYYIVGFLLLTFNYGYFNTQVSLIKLSATPLQMTSANAKFSFVESFIGIMGPVFTGLVFLLARISDGILLAAMVYIISFFTLSRLRVKETRSMKNNKTSWMEELKEGWFTFKANAVLFKTTIYTILLNSSFIVVSTTVIYLAKDGMHLKNSVLAVIFSVSGFGGLIGSLLAGKARDLYGIGKTLGFAAIVNAFAYFVLFLTDNIFMLVAALFIHGAATTLNSICVYTIRHEQTPSHLIGRITGITGTLFRMGMPVTMFCSGWIMMWWGPKVIFLGSAILNIIVVSFFVRSILWKIR